MSEFESCPPNPREAKIITESSLALSRRNFLTGIATAAATLGLTGLSTSAKAASKKYKVCATKDVKLGGGSIFQIKAAKVLLIMVTQPKAGVFRAFNPACTHQGFQMDTVAGSNLVCFLHKATFDTTTGKVTKGPAQRALQSYTLTKEGSFLFVTLQS